MLPEPHLPDAPQAAILDPETLQALFDQAAVGMVQVALDGTWLRVNQRLCDLLGAPREHLLGRSFLELTDPADLAADRALLPQMGAGERSLTTLDKRYLRQDGTTVACHLTISLVRTARGEPAYFMAVIEDVSHRTQLEAARMQALEAQALQRRLRLLQQISEAALTSLDLDALLATLVDTIKTQLEVENVAILLLDEVGQALRVRTARGFEEAVADTVHVPLGQGFAGRIAATRRPVIENDLTRVEMVTSVLREQARSLVGVPILLGNRVLGVLHADSIQPGRFAPEDAELLQLIAERIAQAIDHAQTRAAALAAHAEAAAQAKKWERLFEAISDGVLVYDREGHLLEANPAARHLLGFSEQLTAVEGLSLFERTERYHLRDGDGRPVLPEETPVLRLLRGDQENSGVLSDLWMTTLDGREVALGVRATALLDQTDQIEGVICVIRDITERQRLAERTARALDAVLTMAGALMEAADPEDQPPTADTRPRSLARQLAALASTILGCERLSLRWRDPATGGLEPLAVVGLSAEQEHAWWQATQQFTPLDQRLQEPALAERLQAGEVVVLDLRDPLFQECLLFHGQFLLLVPLHLNQQVYGVLALDTSKTRPEPPPPEDLVVAAAVGKLAALVIERERLLREREEARASLLALYQTNARMETFLGIASHELRTPLTTIQLQIQLLRRRLRQMEAGKGQPPTDLAARLPRFQEQPACTEVQAARLNRLISDLLDTSRIQASTLDLHPEPLDLSRIVQEVVEEQQLAAPERVIRLHVYVLPETEAPVFADPDRIGQVLTNYLTNALKYTSEDRPITVGLDYTTTAARVWVHDHGPGIPEEEQPHVWERFHRVPGTLVQTGSGIGLGLGLHISKTIIDQHHGQVGVESTPGAGSTFWFTLPLARPEEGTQSGAPPPPDTRPSGAPPLPAAE